MLIVAPIYHMLCIVNNCGINMNFFKCVDFVFCLENLSQFQIIPKYVHYLRIQILL